MAARLFATRGTEGKGLLGAKRAWSAVRVRVATMLVLGLPQRETSSKFSSPTPVFVPVMNPMTVTGPSPVLPSLMMDASYPVFVEKVWRTYGVSLRIQ